MQVWARPRHTQEELGAGAQWRAGLCAANMGATSLIPLMMSLALLRRPADNVRNV